MNYMARITFNPNQCGGRPCTRGMRIRVKDVLDLVAAGVPEAEILADYPDLEADDIKASLKYAAAQLDHPVLVASRRKIAAVAISSSFSERPRGASPEHQPV